MVFAVATLDSILLYDTQQATPFAYIGNIHYAALTDVTWYEFNDSDFCSFTVLYTYMYDNLTFFMHLIHRLLIN